jgi:hypothetical protein
MRFPHGRNDDQVDALGLIGQLIDIMLVGRAPVPAIKPIRGIDELTMDEVWRLCRPRLPDPNPRI